MGRTIDLEITKKKDNFAVQDLTNCTKWSRGASKSLTELGGRSISRANHVT